MISKFKKVIAIFLIALFVVSCSVTVHTVGMGAQGDIEKREKAWYLLFGLVPLNKQDANSKNLIPEGTNDYDIKVVTTFADGLITVVANALFPTTISVQTVKVKY